MDNEQHIGPLPPYRGTVIAQDTCGHGPAAILDVRMFSEGAAALWNNHLLDVMIVPAAQYVGCWTPFDPEDEATWPPESDGDITYTVTRLGMIRQCVWCTNFKAANAQYWTHNEITAYCLPTPYKPEGK